MSSCLSEHGEGGRVQLVVVSSFLIVLRTNKVHAKLTISSESRAAHSPIKLQLGLYSLVCKLSVAPYLVSCPVGQLFLRSLETLPSLSGLIRGSSMTDVGGSTAPLMSIGGECKMNVATAAFTMTLEQSTQKWSPERAPGLGEDWAKMDVDHELLTSLGFYVGLLGIKMIIMGPLTARQRFRNKAWKTWRVIVGIRGTCKQSSSRRPSPTRRTAREPTARSSRLITTWNASAGK